MCVAGTGLGILTHGTLEGLGLSAVVLRSAQVYGLLKVAAALYLTVLGIVMLRSGLRRREDAEQPTPAGRQERRPALVAAHVLTLRRTRIESLRDWVNRVGGAVLIFLGARAAALRSSRLSVKRREPGTADCTSQRGRPLA